MTKTRQVKHPVSSLAGAQSVFICNALMGIVPVETLLVADKQHCFDMTASLIVNDKLQRALNGH
jgi:branched-subunit amino acid aminotransferase/4-amino-4-deoxychorismate lyase